MVDSNLQARVIDTFRRHFGLAPDMLFRAPGRVNLIGEHTDYNDGFVLPVAIDRETVVAIGKADGASITAIAADDADDRDRFAIDAPILPVSAGWANYVRGVAQTLLADDVPLTGAQLAIAGNVPLGSGLSSSASLEIAVGLALAGLSDQHIDATRLAKLAQRAENNFVGCACGIMDQLISTRGQAGHALLIDCRSLQCRAVSIPAGVSLIIAHSGVRHAHAEGDYNQRRQQCAAAAQHYGVDALRDLTVAQLEANKAGLDEICYRRARHVVTENARTLSAAVALEQGNLQQLGKLMAQSHTSMRDDFEITVPAIDQLAALMSAALAGQGGARMTGGGFGGCVIAVAPDARVPAVVTAITEQYRTPAGAVADIFVCHPSAGASKIQSWP